MTNTEASCLVRMVEIAFPAVRCKLRQALFVEGLAVADRGFAFDVTHRAHARDDRGDGRVGQDVAQRGFGDLVGADAEVVDEGVDAALHLSAAVTGEVAVAEVAVGEGGTGPELAGEPALVERDSHDDPDAVLSTGG